MMWPSKMSFREEFKSKRTIYLICRAHFKSKRTIYLICRAHLVTMGIQGHHAFLLTWQFAQGVEDGQWLWNSQLGVKG